MASGVAKKRLEDGVKLGLVSVRGGDGLLETIESDQAAALIVEQKIFNFLDQLFLRAEIRSFNVFAEKPAMLIGSLRQEKTAAGRNLHPARGLDIALDFAEESQVDVQAIPHPRGR